MNQQLIDLKNKLAPIADLIQDKNDVFYLDYHLNSWMASAGRNNDDSDTDYFHYLCHAVTGTDF